MLIAQMSDVHIGGARYDERLLDAAIAELNQAGPDLVVVAGDVTDEGYPDQYEAAEAKLQALECANVVLVPGNHDARHVGYLYFEEILGARGQRLRLNLGGIDTALVAVDSSKPDLDEGEIGREHYGWIEDGFGDRSDLRIFLCHHHLMPIPGTGRERNQVLDAGDALALLRRAGVDLVLGGHRHVPYVWPVAGMLLVHSGTVSTLRTRAFPRPAYNLIEVDSNRVSIELRVPGGERESLGAYPRRWPDELLAQAGFRLADRGPSGARYEK
jgi:3',5'-cyclic-AMP phosphodiesterase